ncbi:MAG TPA: hypothetical protein PLC36_10075 [Flavobacterium sp.]|nr:hypothetical protein [Flavobacterium sp.]
MNNVFSAKSETFAERCATKKTLRSCGDGSESLKIYVTPQKSGNRSYIDGTEPPTIAPLVPSGEYILLKE